MAERFIEGPNTNPELGRSAAHVGVKMIQAESCAQSDIGEVQGEVKSSYDQIDELRGTRKPRRDERSTRSKRDQGSSPGKRRHSGRHEQREADNGQDSVKNQK